MASRLMPITTIDSRRSVPLDALRGFALFGIILVNAPFFAAPLQTIVPTGLADRFALWLIATFAAGKFFLIFSFLFGFGFSTILMRAEAQGLRVAGRFMRRLVVLFVFGALHAWLLFFGDILMLYAVLGLVLWFCRNWPTRRLLIVAGTVYVAGVGLQTLALLALGDAPMPLATGAGYLGGFWDAARQRLAELPDSLTFIAVFNGAPALAMFLGGLAFGRSGAFPPDAARLRAMRPVSLACVIGGAVISGLAAAVPFMTRDPALLSVGFLAFCLIAPVISLGMAGTVLAITQDLKTSRPVRWLAIAGGSSLSGYILHSILFGAVFYGWGFGLYGTLNPITVFIIALCVFVTVVAVLNLWRRWFRYGPDEWLLRSIIDLEWKPLRNA
jgi:uncharacterized protein